MRSSYLVAPLIFFFFTISSDTAVAQSTYQDGIDAYASKDCELAVSIFENFKDEVPSYPLKKQVNFYLRMFLCYNELGHDEKVKAALTKYQSIVLPLIQEERYKARQLANVNYPDSAVAYLQSAIHYAKFLYPDDNTDVLEMKEEFIDYCQKRNDWLRVIQTSNEISRIYSQKGDLVSFNRVAITLAKAYIANGQPDQAKVIYEHFLTNTPKYLIKDNPHFIQIISDYANYLFEHDRKESVRPYLIIEMYANQGAFDKSSAAAIYNNLALGLVDQKKGAEALRRYKKAIEVGEEIYPPDELELARFYLNIGILYENMDSTQLAVDYFTRAVPVFHQSSETHNFENAYDHFFLNSSGLILKSLNNQDFDAAAKEFERLMKVEGQLKDRPFHSFYKPLFKSIESFYTMNERYSELERLYLEVVNMNAQKFGKYSHPYVISVVDIGGTYEVTGRYDKARWHFQEGVEAASKIKQEKSETYAYALANLAMFHKNVTIDYTKSQELFKKSIELYRELYDDLSKHTFYNIYLAAYAQVLDAQNEREFRQVSQELQAIPFDDSSFRSITQYMSSQSGLMHLELNRGNLNEAKTISEQLLSLSRKYQMTLRSQLQTTIFLCLMSGDYQKSIGLLEELLGLHIEFVNKNRIFLTEEELGKVYDKVATDLENYNGIVVHSFPDDKDKIGKMFNTSIFTKGLLFDNSRRILSGVLSSGDEGMAEMLNELRTKRDELVNPTNESPSPKVLQQEIASIEKQLSKRSGEVGALINEEPVSWQDILARLKPDEAVVEIVRVETNTEYFQEAPLTYAFLILTSETKDAPKLLAIPEGENMEDKHLSRYRYSIQKKWEDTVSYGVYWKEIDKELSGIKKIYLSPDGVYNLISLPGLYDSENKEFVLDKYDISLISNPADIMNQDDKQRKIKSAVFFGAPEYNYGKKAEQGNQRMVSMDLDKVSSLPGTLKEVQEIEKILKNLNVDTNVRKGTEASESSIKALKSPDILHIATHGFFNPTRGQTTVAGIDQPTGFTHPLLQSGLLLYKDGKDDGILTAYEANNLDLTSTELVVLSACETGRGEIRNGEGVYGLPRAFRAGGAQSVLMSLWKVSDEATKELMIAFYKHLINSGEYAESLRKAQREIKKKFNDPYYWAAFVMVEG